MHERISGTLPIVAVYLFRKQLFSYQSAKENFLGNISSAIKLKVNVLNGGAEERKIRYSFVASYPKLMVQVFFGWYNIFRLEIDKLEFVEC